MGAARHGRALTAFAGALVVLVPSIAMAKTLEGTKTGSEPLQGAVSGPPATGTVAPMIVPPSTVAGSDPPSPAITTDDGKKPDVGDPSFEEPAEESRRSSGAVRSSPAASTASPNASQPAGFSSPGVREAGATTIPVTAPQGAPRQAGPSLPQPRTVEAAPTALALRERASGSPSDSDSIRWTRS